MSVLIKLIIIYLYEKWGVSDLEVGMALQSWVLQDKAPLWSQE